jgi:hypothetical protein
MPILMPEKRILPPWNPSQEKRQSAGYLHCPYCSFITKFTGSLTRHKSRFHEGELAGEGVRSLREGGEKWRKNAEDLIAMGYISCQYFVGTPCPGPRNPLIKRTCQHLADCPGGKE